MRSVSWFSPAPLPHIKGIMGDIFHRFKYNCFFLPFSFPNIFILFKIIWPTNKLELLGKVVFIKEKVSFMLFQYGGAQCELSSLSC